MASAIKKHYHWIIAGLILLEMAVVGGILNNYSSLFILEITEELQIPRASYSIAASLKSLLAFAATLFSAAVFLRFGNRIPLIAGVTVYGCALLLLSVSNSVPMLAFSNAMLGVGEAFCGTGVASRIIGDWFHKHKGTVWGVVAASTGIGGSIICLLLSKVIEVHGWRTAYLTCAIAIGIIAVLVILLMRSKPDNIGLTPYGMGQFKSINKTAHDQFSGPTMAELKKKPAFYLALAVSFLASFSVYLVFSNIIAHLRDQGLSQEEAVAQQSAMLTFLTVSKILMGLLSDHIGAKKASVGTVVFIIISMLLLANVTTPASSTVALICYSLALPFVTVLIPLLSYRLFGYRSHGASLAYFMAMPYCGSLIASPIANATFDALGSYRPIMLISAGIGLITLILMLILFAMAKRIENHYPHE